jgi:hypothetical protein
MQGYVRVVGLKTRHRGAGEGEALSSVGDATGSSRAPAGQERGIEGRDNSNGENETVDEGPSVSPGSGLTRLASPAGIQGFGRSPARRRRNALTSVLKHTGVLTLVERPAYSTPGCQCYFSQFVDRLRIEVSLNVHSAFSIGIPWRLWPKHAQNIKSYVHIRFVLVGADVCSVTGLQAAEGAAGSWRRGLRPDSLNPCAPG